MKWTVIIRPRAESDLEEIHRWYEARRPGLGREFLEEFSRVARVLEVGPCLRPPYYRAFRRILTRRFPYKVFYSLDGDRVIVFRVLHARRDHPRWL